MILRLLFLFCSTLYLSIPSVGQEMYQKQYSQSGNLMQEGWQRNDIKTGYWFTYYSNGTISSQGAYQNGKKNGYWFFYDASGRILKEGHYIDNKAEKWWIIYDLVTNIPEMIVRKVQFKNNKKSGFCFLYKNNLLFKAEKYENDHKIGEWTDVFSFKKDNPNASL